jgi:hypothetical protein
VEVRSTRQSPDAAGKGALVDQQAVSASSACFDPLNAALTNRQWRKGPRQAMLSA